MAMKGISLKIRNPDELAKYISLEQDPALKIRLIFIRCFHENYNDLEMSCKIFNISTVTGYDWIKKWNDFGIDGLRDKQITGRIPKLSTNQIDELKSKLKEKDFWELDEVKDLIKSEFNAELSKNRVYSILRKIGMTYTKPYRKDCKRPENAEEILINSLGDVCKLLENDGIDPNSVVIGFLDEASPQNRANSGKFWSFGQKAMKVNSTKYKANTIAFYALNGKDVIMFLDDSKSEEISYFFKQIRKENPDPEYIIVVLQNYSTHKTELPKKAAADIGIYLVFLPPYSPDLNPIEFIWKSVRMAVSKFFITSEKHLKDIITIAYSLCSQTISFADSWLSKIANSVPYLRRVLLL